jgi:hypothetical protein
MQWKRKKENGGFGVREKNSNANGGRRLGKKGYLLVYLSVRASRL